MSEETIDDDALLSGLPSWKDNFQPQKRSTESSLIQKNVETTQMRPPPSITSITADDDARMALRMAALKTLKRRKANSGVTQQSESSAFPKDAPEPKDELVEQRPIHTDQDTQAQRLTTASSKKLIKQSAGKQLEYTDVDAPEISSDNEPINDSGMSHPRRSRQRISYADEFNAKIEPPLGDIEMNSGINRSRESAMGQSYTMSDYARKVKSRQVTTPPLGQPGPSRLAATSTHFVKDPSWKPLIIDLSDEEDDENPNGEDAAQKISRPQVIGNQQILSKTRSVHTVENSESELSRKEKEIERMLATIRELEQRKRGTTTLKSDKPTSQILGKRLNNTEDRRHADDTMSDSIQHADRETIKVCLLRYSVTHLLASSTTISLYFFMATISHNKCMLSH